MQFWEALKPSARRGLFIAGFAIIGSGVVGYMSFRAMGDVVIEEMTREHIQLAHMIGMSIEKDGALDGLSEIWENLGPKHSGEYLCVVNQGGRVAFHTSRPHAVGKNVGHIKLVAQLEGQPKTLGALVNAGLDYAGMHLNSHGERQIAVFGFRPKLNALIAIHVPVDMVHKKTWEAAWPWGVGFVVLTCVLWPLALVGVCRAYQLSEDEIVNMNQQLWMQNEQQNDLQAQLLQSQKMEAVGQLAGGLAHDFNNLLTGILGCVHFLKENMAAHDPRLEDVEEIKRAAEHGAALTRQLLAFSRKQIVRPCDVDLNETMLQMKKMLGRLLGEHITIRVNCEDNVPPVWVDPNLIEVVLLNLVLNARDAMPYGGTLTLEVRDVDFVKVDVEYGVDVIPGDYVLITVRDTGIGMDEETESRIFEPFFTTKDSGKGTGLGLSTVHGIVKQSNGQIAVHSIVGQGTVFEVYLPKAKKTVRDWGRETVDTSKKKEDTLARSPATVLVVEDELAVRNLVVRLLEMVGYTVWKASNGKEALHMYGDRLGAVDIILTDVIMPEMDGLELVAQVIDRGFTMPVVYLSGYIEKEIPGKNLIPSDALLLQKPFEMDGILDVIQKALDKRNK